MHGKTDNDDLELKFPGQERRPPQALSCSVLFVALIASCSRGNPPPPEVSIIVSSKRIEVFTNDCPGRKPFAEDDQCDSEDWELFPQTLCRTDLFDCEPVIRLTQGRNSVDKTGRWATFSPEQPLLAGATVTLDGCWDTPLMFELPAPRVGELELSLGATSMTATSTGEPYGMFARLVGTKVLGGYWAQCHSSAPRVAVPVTTPGYFSYEATAFAFDEPTSLEANGVFAKIYSASFQKRTLFPLQETFETFGRAAELVSRASRWYTPCERMCSAQSQACDMSGEVTVPVCQLRCVADGEQASDCDALYSSAIECLSETDECSRDDESRACEEETNAVRSCLVER